MKTNGDTRYFTSFSIFSYPIVPLNEIDMKAAQELTTYYETRFDSCGLVTQFIKYLKQREPQDLIVWQKVFTEEYEYYATGHLKQRRLTVPGSELKVWHFDDKPANWSTHLDSFASSLFSGKSTRDAERPPAVEDMELVDRLVICHELMSELDGTLFETIARQPRTADWILSSLIEQLPRFKDIIQIICPQSNPRVLFLSTEPKSTDSKVASDSDQCMRALEGFDSIGGIKMIEDVLDPYFDRRIATPHQIPLKTVKDPDAESWLTANEMAYLLVMPMRAKHGQELEAAGLLCLVLSREYDDRVTVAHASIFRRFGQLCQTTFDIAQVGEPIEEPGSS